MFISMILETFSIGLILPALTLIDNPKIITEYAYLKNFYFYDGEPNYNIVVLFVIIVLCLFYLNNMHYICNLETVTALIWYSS